MKGRMILASVFMGCLLGADNALSATNTSDDWDDGLLHGWMGNTAATVVQVHGSGGNPDGYLLSQSQAGGNPYSTIGAMTHDSRYTGDFAAAGVYRVSVDLNLLSGGMREVLLRFRYLDFSHNGWTYRLEDSAMPAGQWRHHEVNIDPNWTDAQAMAAGWVQEPTSASFRDTMAHVYSTEIRVVGISASTATTFGIDNFALHASSGGDARAVPMLGIPALLALAGGLLFFARRSFRRRA